MLKVNHRGAFLTFVNVDQHFLTILQVQNEFVIRHVCINQYVCAQATGGRAETEMQSTPVRRPVPSRTPDPVAVKFVNLSSGASSSSSDSSSTSVDPASSSSTSSSSSSPTTNIQLQRSLMSSVPAPPITRLHHPHQRDAPLTASAITDISTPPVHFISFSSGDSTYGRSASSLPPHITDIIPSSQLPHRTTSQPSSRLHHQRTTPPRPLHSSDLSSPERRPSRSNTAGVISAKPIPEDSQSNSSLSECKLSPLPPSASPSIMLLSHFAVSPPTAARPKFQVCSEFLWRVNVDIRSMQMSYPLCYVLAYP